MSTIGRKLIGIAGASGSGKTTIARKWASSLNAGDVLSFDSFYYSIRADEDPDSKNFDHPDALDMPLFCEYLRTLRNGGEISVPDYDFKTHKRVGEHAFTSSGEYVIVEGILLLHFEEIRELLDFSVFIDVPFDLCVERRLRRDCEERGRTHDQALRQIRNTVEPMYQEFVSPSRHFADQLIAPSNGFPSIRLPDRRIID